MANQAAQAQAEYRQVDEQIAAIEARLPGIAKNAEASYSKSGRERLGLTTNEQVQEVRQQQKDLERQRSALYKRRDELYPIAFPKEAAEEAADKRAEAREDAAEKAARAREDAADKAARQKEQQKDAKAKQNWDDDSEESQKATKTGPRENRTTKTVSEETVTGGGSTTTKYAEATPAQKDYYRKLSAAEEAETAEFQQKRQEYLRSKGLENASEMQQIDALARAERLREIPREAEFVPGAKFRAANPPPPGAPAVTTEQKGEEVNKKETTITKEGGASNNAGDVVEQSKAGGPIVNEKAGISETGAVPKDPQSKNTGKDSSSAPGTTTINKGEKAQIDQAKTGSNSAENKTDVVQADANGKVKNSAGQVANGSAEPPPESATPAIQEKVTLRKSGATTSYISENVLHQYATYTYSISLHMLTKDSYNKMADGGDWLPEAKTLIAGGGRYGTDPNNRKKFVRSAYFKDDFYFENLSMTTITGLNAQTKGTNSIDISFNIIEPYGLTLLNRLLALSEELGQPNYTANPYVLQIDFFGNTDKGEPLNPIPNTTKFIPIGLMEMGIKVSTGGAIYACRARIYSHEAFTQSTSSTPTTIEVYAKTVQDFFSNDTDESNIKQQVIEKNEQREELTQLNNNQFTFGAEKDKRKASLTATVNQGFKVKSYSGGYNAYQEYLKSSGTIQHASTVKFIVDPTLNTEIVYPKKTSVSSVAMSTAKDGGAAGNVKKGGGAAAAGPDTGEEKFSINAGEGIVAIINKVMRSSKYITSQLKDDGTTQEGDKDGIPVNWFKIIPNMKLTNFDTKQNCWATDTTYHIVPYEYHNVKHPMVSTSSPEEMIKQLRKKYAYIYTGHNMDVIDFNIDFNSLFFNLVNVLTENTVTASTAADNAKKAEKRASPLPAQATGGVQPVVNRPVSGHQSSSAGFNAQENAAVQKVANVMDSIYSPIRGDMLNLDMRIIGDPEFIKSDDVYLKPGNPNYPKAGDTRASDGSILTDQGDVFIYVEFKTPVDIDQETGLLRKDDNYLQSSFSGIYKLIKVVSEFKGGKFEQQLQAVRVGTTGENAIINLKDAQAIVQRLDTSEGTVDKQNTVKESQEIQAVPVPDAAPPEQATDSKSNVDKAGKTAENENKTPQDADKTKLANIAANGTTVDATKQPQEGSNPSMNDVQPKQAQPDSGPKVDNAAKELENTTKPKSATQNLPPGVTADEWGRFTYRGITFKAVSAEDRDKVIAAIDNGTKVTVKRWNSEAYVDTEFDGSKEKPLSKDPEIAALQEKHQTVYRNLVINTRRRINNMKPGGPFGSDSPDDKERREKYLPKLQAEEAAQQKELDDIEAQLKQKGSAPITEPIKPL
jgi:hypothetical protein